MLKKTLVFIFCVCAFHSHFAQVLRNSTFLKEELNKAEQNADTTEINKLKSELTNSLLLEKTIQNGNIENSIYLITEGKEVKMPFRPTASQRTISSIQPTNAEEMILEEENSRPTLLPPLPAKTMPRTMKSGLVLELLTGINSISSDIKHQYDTDAKNFKYKKSPFSLGAKLGTRFYFNSSEEFRIGWEFNVNTFISLSGYGFYPINILGGPSVLYTKNRINSFGLSVLLGPSLIADHFFSYKDPGKNIPKENKQPNDVYNMYMPNWIGVMGGASFRYGIKKLFLGLDLLLAIYPEVTDIGSASIPSTNANFKSKEIPQKITAKTNSFSTVFVFGVKL